MVGYLTPSVSPATSICRALFIPDDEEYLAIVRGCLQTLTFPEAWTPFGTLTPDQAAANFVDMFDRFCLEVGVCRLIGEIVCFAGPSNPSTEFLPADGASYLRTDYPDLFNVIGVIYGAVDSTHFNIPYSW